MPRRRRSRIPLLLLAVLAALHGCAQGPQAQLPTDVDQALEAGRAAAEAWIEAGRGAARTPPGGEAVVALGYLERLRLGLGSPFRLAAFALHDPRLADSTRERVAWALLARTVDGDAYHIDPALLVADVAAGTRQLRLIEEVVAGAPDPRAGELAVRLAYAMAGAEGAVGAWTEWAAVRVAALVRDRELARADALRLLAAAHPQGTGVLQALELWRAERRFEVEQPTLEPLAPRSQRLALQLAPRIAAAIRAARLGDTAPRRPLAAFASGTEAGGPGEARPLLGGAAARALAGAAGRLDAPPETPVVVAVDRFLQLQAGREEAEGGGAARRRMEGVHGAESLAAAHALLRPGAGARATHLARVVLESATGLRAFAQEEPWFPGAPGPTADELVGLYGLASVRFDDDVPHHWRPYYTRLVSSALTDLQRVVPTAQFRGLRLRFTGERLEGGALARHSPSARTLLLPVHTAAGTLAHELAHDLDWQAARRDGVRGDYASDRALRAGRVRLLRMLSPDTLSVPRPGQDPRAMHAARPAEVFARGVDWFVVAALAREGRRNGYLSSIQDDVLRGYGSVRPPDLSGRAGDALMAILDPIAPVPPDVRRRFLDRFGSGRALLPYDVVRGIVEAAPGPELPEARPVDAVELPAAALRSPLLAVERARAAALANIDAWSCRAVGVAHDFELELELRRIADAAAAARTRGLLLEWGGVAAGTEGRAWVAERLRGSDGGGQPPDSTLAAAIRRELERLRALEDSFTRNALTHPLQSSAACVPALGL